MKNVRWWLMCSVLPVLVACGGGGSSCKLLGSALCNSEDPVAPVAQAGANQSVLLGRGAVQLDGSRSTDANGDVISYQWTLSVKPLRSTATLSGANSVRPTFTPDLTGTYVFDLVVSDGRLSSTSRVAVTASEVNAPPVANAGVDQSVVVNAVVTLDGRDSSDANRDDQLTFTWSLVRPDGSSQVLTGVRPTFTAALTGNYTASLTVRDGVESSEPDAVRVVVSAVNAAPVAAISALSGVVVGSSVQLSAAGSTDGNRDPLTYRWSLLSKPMKATGALADSAATLAPPTTMVNPSFTADVAGVYVVSLVVHDGKVNSDPVTVAVTASAANLPPVANAGAEQVVALAQPVTLTGSASTDANGDTLSYQWSLTTRPAGSTVTLTGPNTVSPTFTPDVAGFYVATLTVDDSKGGTHVSRVLIKVE